MIRWPPSSRSIKQVVEAACRCAVLAGMARCVVRAAFSGAIIRVTVRVLFKSNSALFTQLTLLIFNEGLAQSRAGRSRCGEENQ
jgi:hypothetical protein